MPEFRPGFPGIPGTYELTRTVPDHELLLVFNDDDIATEFYDWLHGPGWTAFQEWRKALND